VFALELAVVVCAVFLTGVIREPRSFGNAVLLGLALALGALGLAERLAEAPERPEHLLLRALLLAVALGPFFVGCFLVANGVTMIRRESLRPSNLLSLLAGAAVFVVIGLDVAAERAGDVKLSLFATVATLVFGYVSFLFVSYVLYAFVYGLLARTGGADFVVVLGAGLRADGGVPPLLANRLERGREVWAELNRQEGLDRRPGEFRPLLIVSGGKGGDERVPEASAMASYLITRGFPADRLLLEDQSRSTEENLAFSKAIMDAARPADSGSKRARCVIVTSNYHVFRTAITARKTGIRGQVTGAHTAGYYWPSAMLREFAAVFLRYWVVNIGICSALALAPIAYAVAGRI
jgi:uncharacterized SAM-binding protein YcdF (DUF218 family)